MSLSRRVKATGRHRAGNPARHGFAPAVSEVLSVLLETARNGHRGRTSRPSRPRRFTQNAPSFDERQRRLPNHDGKAAAAANSSAWITSLCEVKPPVGRPLFMLLATSRAPTPAATPEARCATRHAPPGRSPSLSLCRHAPPAPPNTTRPDSAQMFYIPPATADS